MTPWLLFLYMRSRIPPQSCLSNFYSDSTCPDLATCNFPITTAYLLCTFSLPNLFPDFIAHFAFDSSRRKLSFYCRNLCREPL